MATSRGGASTMATASGGVQTGVKDGTEATEDGTAVTGSLGHARVTTSTVKLMKFRANVVV